MACLRSVPGIQYPSTSRKQADTSGPKERGVAQCLCRMPSLRRPVTSGRFGLNLKEVHMKILAPVHEEYLHLQTSSRLFKLCLDLLGNAADGLQQKGMPHDSGMAIYIAMHLCSRRNAALVSSFSFKVRIVLNSNRMPFVTCIP